MREKVPRTHTIRLTPIEIDHIWGLLDDNEREGTYWGPKTDYWKRHTRVRDKLREALGLEKGERKK